MKFGQLNPLRPLVRVLTDLSTKDDAPKPTSIVSRKNGTVLWHARKEETLGATGPENESIWRKVTPAHGHASDFSTYNLKSCCNP